MLNLRNISKYRNSWWVIAGVIFLVLFILTTGSIGFYSIYKSHQDSKDYIDAVDYAREIQVLMQKQFQIWRKIVLEGENPNVFRKEYLEFSRYSAVIQDLLFNLKTTCSDFGDMPDKILRLSRTHNSISYEYSSLLSELEVSGFAKKDEVINRAKGKDDKILNGIDGIVEEIKATSSDRINRINDYYLKILLSILVVQVLIASLFSFNLAKRFISERSVLEKSIRAKTRDLAEAGKKIRFSEEKYRRIVEGSKEIFFSLDDSFHVVAVNNAVKEHFNIKPDSLHGRNFIELVHEDLNGKNLSKDLIWRTLEGFTKERTPVQFKAEFKMPRFIESKTMNVRLEYIDVEGRQEILGRASISEEDGIQKYIVNERMTMHIGNSLIAADEVTFRLTNMFKKHMDSGDAKLVRLALREIVINAIEHGNLNITFAEKSEAMLHDDYFNLINRRQKNEACRERKVMIDYSLDPEKVVYRITDEGAGFDHESVMNKTFDQLNGALMAHGRGINLSREIFDTVRYNDKGNRVVLVKYF